MLASDLDGTVIPTTDAVAYSTDIIRFASLVRDRNRFSLAYITGRHLELALAGIDQYGLPMPDALVCDVGSTIYWRHNTGWQPDPVYRLAMLQSWHGLNGNGIAALLDGITGLTVQEEERQKEFKQSYYLPDMKGRDTVLRQIRDRLKDGGIDASVIYSVDPVRQLGLVDVLPLAADKAQSLHFLRQTLGVSEENTVFAGDSGNDLLAFVSGCMAIVVANTPTAVRQEVIRRAAAAGISGRIYLAESSYTRGVIEGCRHFGLL